MALLDEEVVEYWLNNMGFFCMRGVKTGLGEIDFLAIRPKNGSLEYWHVEVTVSFRPIGYIGGGSSAKRRSAKDMEVGIYDWIHKKFTSEQKVEKRKAIVENADWKYVLVCADVKHDVELDLLSKKGIEVHRYKDILRELVAARSQVNSTAGTIVEILRYVNKD